MIYSSDIIQSQNDIHKNLLDIDYFNLEVSSCGSTLVINASKKGINTFLEKFGALERPPETIALNTRPQRVWASRSLQTKRAFSDRDPTCLRGESTYEKNSLYNELKIKFIKDASESCLLSPSFKKDVGPYLTLNQKGWHKFLEMVRHLLENYWFYVTAPLNESWSHLPFLLTSSTHGDSDSYPLKAIECIRLEPEEKIYLRNDLSSGSLQVRGNSAGLLLFAKWVQDFMNSSETSIQVLNPFNDIFKSILFKDYDPSQEVAKETLFFTKCAEDKPYPVISFGTSEDQSRLHLFCNLQGLDELADLFESSAFFSDHDDYYLASPDKRYMGDLSNEVNVLPPIKLIESWDLLEGAHFNPAYNSRAKAFFEESALDHFSEEADEFINNKIIKTKGKL